MRNAVVVGVDESKAATRALRWAVDEAYLHDFSLLIVNVPSEESDQRSWKLLKRCAQIASFRQPTVPVSTMAAQGTPTEVLAELSAQASLVVLGARGGDQSEHALGSVARRTASHATSPVVIVPENMDAAAEARSHRTVVIGVSADPAGRHAFEAALLEARRRGAIVNAVIGGAEETLDENAPGAELPEPLAEIARRFPTVTVVVNVREEEPAVALTAAAKHADILVIGCHHTSDQWGTRLGAVPSAMLGYVDTPVMVVSASADTTELDSQLVRSHAGK